MNYAEKMKIEPFGTVYRFTQEKINALVNGYVKEQVGADLTLIVGCLDETYDVFIRWDVEEVDDFETKYSEEQWRVIDEIGIHQEEWFLTRNAIFQAIFGTERIGYSYDKNFKVYEITVVNPKFTYNA